MGLCLQNMGLEGDGCCGAGAGSAKQRWVLALSQWPQTRMGTGACLLRGKCSMCPAHAGDSGVPSLQPAPGSLLVPSLAEDTFLGKIVTEVQSSKAQAAHPLYTGSCVSVLSPVVALFSAGTQTPDCMALPELSSYPAGPASLPAPALPVPHSCGHLGSLQTMHSAQQQQALSEQTWCCTISHQQS